jgi:hypothetical protein
MFTYFAILLETGVFDTIDVNFMIVGHTHSEIDQYFSVLSTAIGKAEFIGSPMALWQLLSEAHGAGQLRRRPVVNRLIEVYYDIVSLFAPYRNTNVKGYGVPFNFRLKMVCGKAVLQYRLFSSNPLWLPKEPEGRLRTLAEMYDAECIVVQAPPLAIVNGEKTLMKALDLQDTGVSKIMRSKVLLGNFNAVTAMLPDLRTLELSAMDQQAQRFADEEGPIPNERARYTSQRADLINIQRTLDAYSDNSECGYIMFVDSVRSANEPPLSDLRPKAFDPTLLVELIDAHLAELGKTPVASDHAEWDIDKSEGDDDDNELATVMPPMSKEFKVRLTGEQKKFMNKAAEIVAACRKMMAYIKKRRVAVSAAPGDYNHDVQLNLFRVLLIINFSCRFFVYELHSQLGGGQVFHNTIFGYGRVARAV